MHDKGRMQARESSGANRSDRIGLSVCLELTKARLAALVVLTTLVGFVLATRGSIDAWLLAWTLAGTALTAGGALALNQWMEARRDGLMRRTCARPVPSGKISPRLALHVGLSLVLIGLAALALQTNLLTAALALTIVCIYVFAYTPLKPVSSLCTLVGALCGALPPLMGWTAASGASSMLHIEPGAWILSAILFVWQVPHFLALAWLYREDYARGGFRMLPLVDPSGATTGRMAIIYSVALLPLSLGLAAVGLAGRVYVVGALALGGGLLALAILLFRHRTESRARRLFVGSIIYLAALMVLMLTDRGPAAGSMHLEAANTHVVLADGLASR